MLDPVLYCACVEVNSETVLANLSPVSDPVFYISCSNVLLDAVVSLRCASESGTSPSPLIRCQVNVIVLII